MAEPEETNKSSHEQIYRILYSSQIPRQRSATDIEDDIESILRWSRDKNPTLGVTGALVTNKRMYAQIIEGPSSVVKDLLGHIACDTRHHEVRIINCHKSDKRIFEDWSMAFIRTNRNLEAEAYLFPSGNEQSNIMAISAFCMSVRNHIAKGTEF